MRIFTLSTRAYDADIAKLLRRRLDEAGVYLPVQAHGAGADVAVETDGELSAFVCALSRMLLFDISQFELARIVDEFDIPIEYKQAVLEASIKKVRRESREKRLSTALRDYFEEADALTLEGFFRFRMEEELRACELAAAAAVQELVLREEYLSIMSLLSMFVCLQPARAGELCIVMQKNGDCTLTDDSDTKIKCRTEDYDDIINILIGLAPKSIVIYDLSQGESELFIEAVKCVFKNRVSVRK